MKDISDNVMKKRLRPLRGLDDDALLIHEIYHSIQGESTYAGLPCVFVRTTACNLRCTYCDTRHAFDGGETMSIDAVVDAVGAYGCDLVEITGGEPLVQPAVYPLMTRLCDAGYRVLLETGGSIAIDNVDARVVKIVDFKTPSSGEVDANAYGIIASLAPHDEVKIVVGSREDFDWMLEFLREHQPQNRCAVLVGGVWGSIEAHELAQWIIESGAPVRMQLQLHKYIWDPKARGV